MHVRLSVVLVVHGEQGYIDECASSLLGQAPDGIELIAVDDAASGHAPELLDRLAERDARVRVEHLAERAGLGASRDLGLELARGEYVWFAEASGRWPEGAIAGVLERLDATAADVLVLGRAQRDPGPLESHAALARGAPRIWDKVFRRELLAGARFGRGRFAELAVTVPALAGAERIATLGSPAYVHRSAGADRPEGMPLDAFDNWDAGFARMARDVPEKRRAIAAAAMLRHGLSLVERAPRAERRRLFGRLSQSYRRHATADGWTPRLVRSGNYAAYAALARTRRARAALARRRGRARKRRQREQLERHYRRQLRRPIDPDLAVFAAYWYRGYACNPRAIYEKARELVPGMRGVWVVKREGVDALPPGVEYVVAGTPEYYETIARARYLVNNVNFPNHLVKRDGSVHVMTHHGTPLKRMGLDQRDAPVSGARMDFEGLARRCRRWDFSVSANPFSTIAWARAYPFQHETLETGYPRNDVLAAATEEDVAAARAELGLEPGQTAVLYAPTHREWQPAYESPVDLAAVAEALGPSHVVLARLHYFYDADPRLRELHRAGRVRDVSAHPSVEQLCLAADVLVTDYSSIMFDYAVLDRPIVIHAPDWDIYKALRGVYFDLMSEPPGVVTGTEDGLVEALRSGADDVAARTAFRERFCSLEDGGAAERVVRRVWFGERVPAPAASPAVLG
jgi:CDP-glycerol glycerophosphotransferase